MSSSKKDGFGVLGIGAAACVACCAGPVLALLGGLSLAGIASTLFIGAAGLVIAAAAAAGVLLVRRRQADSACAADPAEPVPVGAPTRKIPAP